MNKVMALGLALSLGVVGCDAFAPPPKRACNKLATLCEMDVEQASHCGEELAKAERVLGKESMAKLTLCVKESTSCAEATGCMAGTGFEELGGQLNKFMKGFNRALAQ